MMALKSFDLDLVNSISQEKKVDIGKITEEEMTNDFLYVTGLFYYGLFDYYVNFQSKLSDVHNTICVSVGFVSREVVPVVSISTGKVVGVEKGGILIDIPMFITNPISLTDDDDSEVAWMKIMGLWGSTLEHSTIEMLFDIESVSTVKIFAEATEQNISIFTIDNSSTMDSILDTISAEDDIKDKVRAYVTAGYVVHIPQTLITLNSWTGFGWIACNEATGSAGYQIQGGLNGGNSTETITDEIFDISLEVAEKVSGTTDAMAVGGSMLIVAGARASVGVIAVLSAETTTQMVGACFLGAGGIITGAIFLTGAIIVTIQLLSNTWKKEEEKRFWMSYRRSYVKNSISFS